LQLLDAGQLQCLVIAAQLALGVIPENDTVPIKELYQGALNLTTHSTRSSTSSSPAMLSHPSLRDQQSSSVPRQTWGSWLSHHRPDQSPPVRWPAGTAPLARSLPARRSSC